MSLIATCKYQMDEFPAAAAYYQKLIQLAKDNDDYKFNLAMCLYKSGDYSAALKVITQLFLYRMISNPYLGHLCGCITPICRASSAAAIGHKVYGGGFTGFKIAN